ncbi:MAG: pyruvate kinase, partial [Candidatus Eisenbacteria bacterium]|nr:pyruvate kinase [Candidatus Eisenbacteria bacterium]
MRQTKIICTIGPATSSPETIRALIRAGMDVARINFSHGGHDTKAQAISTIRRVADDERRLVAILADLQGPKLRVGDLPDAG